MKAFQFHTSSIKIIDLNIRNTAVCDKVERISKITRTHLSTWKRFDFLYSVAQIINLPQICFRKELKQNLALAFCNCKQMKDSKLKVKPLKNFIMKTIDKVQKTVLKSLVVITGFVLISFTATTQDLGISFTQNNTNNKLAFATVDNRIEPQTASTTATIITDIISYTGHLTTESEDMLELEEWMTNVDLFCNEQFPVDKEMTSTSSSGYRELKDPGLVSESWMYNLKYWTVNR